MKFPCPECERPLAPDVDWQYCPYCGSLLHHSSKVAEWREVARYEKFGAASLICDELIARGIPCRLRAEVGNIDLAHSSVFHVEGGRPYQALDVSSDVYGEAIEAIASIQAEQHNNEIEPDAPTNAVAEKTASVLITLIVLGFAAVIVIAILGAVFSWADKEFFGG